MSNKVSDFVNSHNQGEVEEWYGPMDLYYFHVWEVWVYDKDEEEWATRFVVSRQGREFEYFEDFLGLVSYTQSLIRTGQDGDGRSERQLNWFKVIVAAIAFLAGVGVVLWRAATAKDDGWAMVSVAGSLVASGGSFFFGRWINTPHITKAARGNTPEL